MIRDEDLLEGLMRYGRAPGSELYYKKPEHPGCPSLPSDGTNP